jgi:hypothetical protein
MVGKPEAFRMLFNAGAKVDGGLGKRRVQERSIACKDGSVRRIAWVSMSQEQTFPGWSQCWIGLDVTELGMERIGKSAQEPNEKPEG